MPEQKLKLAEGRSVPMEDGSVWPADGATVEVTLYIRRRLADGDLVAADDEIAEPKGSKPVDPPTPEDPDTSGRKGRNGGK
ncbi:DUF2635 domain-containing protein [Mesorhizobium sp. 2RAF21]|uniref:DUF2635 domain-containing protein n=1 Tax=Mesorhizobium sp. 2RAF21 TaxID=3232995 RepID=UPI003F962CA8